MSDKHLLAINTVTGSCSIAISKGVNLLTQRSIVVEKGYAEILIPLIETALDEVKLKLKNLDGFLVCTGPGNYTSLRIATSTARGLSLACNRPACGISLFEILATDANKNLVLIKGPGDKIYTQKFSNGLAMSAPQLMTVNEIQEANTFLNLITVGYQAKRVGEFFNSNDHRELDDISFEKFVALGLAKLNDVNQRPAPIYVR